MAVYTQEKTLIGNILLEESDSDEEYHERFTKTKRLVLLNKEELAHIERSTSAPAGFLAFPPIFWPTPPHPMNIAATDFIPPSSPTKASPSFKGLVLTQAMDQQGSRYLQQVYETGSLDDKEALFEELFKVIYTLITDVFGNYVVQKAIEFGTEEQRHAIIQKLFGRVMEFSVHTYGCRVVQKAFEWASESERIVMATETKGHIEKCIENQNANHVIQKCIETLPFTCIGFIIESLKNNTIKWANHAYGCRVLQRLIQFCPKEVLYPILQTLVRNAGRLSQQPYGNYVIQFILEKGQPSERTLVINGLKGHLCDLSKHKFSSNVIEKSLLVATPDQISAFASELFTTGRLVELCTDKFGNFVVQKVIEVSQREQANRLIDLIKAQAPTLRGTQQGRYVLNFIEKKFSSQR